MNTNNAALTLIKDIKTAKVSFFNNPKLYTYVTKFDVKVGDFVVVEAPDIHNQVNTMLKVVEVKEVLDFLDLDFDSQTHYKFIISKVEQDDYNNLKIERNKIVASLRRTRQKTIHDQVKQSLLEDLKETENRKQKN